MPVLPMDTMVSENNKKGFQINVLTKDSKGRCRVQCFNFLTLTIFIGVSPDYKITIGPL